MINVDTEILMRPLSTATDIRIVIEAVREEAIED